MTLDTEPTSRLPVVDVPSAVITTDLHIARTRANSARRARAQRRWDILGRVLSYLFFGGTLGLLIGICGTLFALALSLADHDSTIPAPEPTTTAAAITTLPSMPPTAYPLLGGVTAAATAPPSTTRPRPTPTTARPARTTVPAPATTPTAHPPPAATTSIVTSSTTTTPSTTTAPAPTDPPSTPAPTDPTPAPTDPSTTTTTDTTTTTTGAST